MKIWCVGEFVLLGAFKFLVLFVHEMSLQCLELGINDNVLYGSNYASNSPLDTKRWTVPSSLPLWPPSLLPLQPSWHGGQTWTIIQSLSYQPLGATLCYLSRMTT
jgi:hypothetical protein